MAITTYPLTTALLALMTTEDTAGFSGNPRKIFLYWRDFLGKRGPEIHRLSKTFGLPSGLAEAFFVLIARIDGYPYGAKTKDDVYKAMHRREYKAFEAALTQVCEAPVERKLWLLDRQIGKTSMRLEGDFLFYADESVALLEQEALVSEFPMSLFNLAYRVAYPGSAHVPVR